MRRLTTPEHRFVLELDQSIIKKIKITYAQEDEIILEKNLDDVKFKENTAIIKLSQEETKLFSPDKMVKIQIRVLTTGNDALASDIMNKYIDDVLDDEVI